MNLKKITKRFYKEKEKKNCFLLEDFAPSSFSRFGRDIFIFPPVFDEIQGMNF
ncbi:hypothetical protein [Methanosarcina siciliae]|uniref:hypothetical protein n=1 Tax=Methanosarcina siciliae TaxID=38027 RepID=UPI000A54F2CC|nr:hypothetical protein [Methanosarcina siciliae]